MATGKKTGGRKRGTPNKKSRDVLERLEDLKSDPLGGLAEFATGAATCHTCDAKGKVSIDQYYTTMRITMDEEIKQLSPEQRSEPQYTCPLCRGTKHRALEDQLVLRARSELMQYIAPKRKAMDINHNTEMTWEEMLEKLK